LLSEYEIVPLRHLFLDELPWLAGPQSSEMITELGYFWNSWADRQRNVVLVVCGSATSWMLDNVIRDYGGLHGRLTDTIRLLPFTLKECETYFKSRGFHLSRYETAVAYMAFGGIPFKLQTTYQDTLHSTCHGYYKWCKPKRALQGCQPGSCIG